MGSVGTLCFGIDLAQSFDRTAVVVAEASREPRPPEKGSGHWTVYKIHFAHRLPLGMSYPAIVDRLLEIMCNEKTIAYTRKAYVDATGVGRPIVDMLKDACRHRPEARGIFINPVTITAGEGRYNATTGSVSKNHLASRGDALLGDHRIRGTNRPEVKVCIDELRTFDRSMTDHGNAVYGGRPGTHDDLAIAFLLAIMEEQKTADDHLFDLRQRIETQAKRASQTSWPGPRP